MSRSLQFAGILCGIICLVCITSAISVGNIGINPSGDLVSGVTRASASFVVNFPSSGGYTFDNDHTLQMDTELDDAVWTYSIYLDGIENPSKSEAGPNIRLSGWELSYPSNREISLKVRVEGTAPEVDVSKEQILVRVRELDNRNAVISGTEVVKTKMVLNPETIGESLAAESATLASLRSRIDQLAAGGIDTSSPETKYGQADALLRSAESASDFARAQSDLSKASSLIDQLESEVVILEAQKAIADAESSIGETENLITYFKVNKSMGSDARLMPILSKWEIAAERLTAARDLYSDGEYEDAARKANEAAAKGDEVLTDAQALKEKVDANPLAALGGIGSAFTGSIVTILIIVVVVVLVIVGIIFFRRRRRWDELG
ncbi:MAG: hypothetical protein GKC05_06975 [Methanomicrobiales archaeon]|nr:hypothetical protein [Methanomicrobiales archaeon]NYT21467.1 hypothetical protein [Methanomicrobiales archaeon]